MARGNQRDLARAKNQKKQQEVQKKKGSTDKDGNKGLSLEAIKARDAEVMRLKQVKAAEKKAQDQGAAKEWALILLHCTRKFLLAILLAASFVF